MQTLGLNACERCFRRIRARLSQIVERARNSCCPFAVAREQNHPTAKAGAWGERVAESYLKQKGWRILGCRVRPSARDEIDLVARDGAVLVFVEVKTRASESYGRPADSVNRKKRHVLSRAAVRYLAKLDYPAVNIRFDVIEVVGTAGMQSPHVRHIENAFALDRCYRLPY